MNDSTSCSHPLHVSGTDHSFVSEAVTMLDCSAYDVRDSLDAAMRVPRKSLLVVCWLVSTEIIEKEERIIEFRLSESECPFQMNAGTFERWHAPCDPLDWPDCHDHISFRLTRTSVTGRNRGGLRCFVACSKAYASFRSTGSLQARPKNDIPTGRPNTDPAGTVMLG